MPDAQSHPLTYFESFRRSKIAVEFRIYQDEMPIVRDLPDLSCTRSPTVEEVPESGH